MEGDKSKGIVECEKSSFYVPAQKLFDMAPSFLFSKTDITERRIFAMAFQFQALSESLVVDLWALLSREKVERIQKWDTYT